MVIWTVIILQCNSLYGKMCSITTGTVIIVGVQSGVDFTIVQIVGGDNN